MLMRGGGLVAEYEEEEQEEDRGDVFGDGAGMASKRRRFRTFVIPDPSRGRSQRQNISWVNSA